MVRRSLAAVVVVPLVLACCAGCTRELSRSKVESKLASGYEQSTGHQPRSVHCPGDLEGRVGASERCTITGSDGVTKTYTVTMTEVHGSKYEVHVQEVS